MAEWRRYQEETAKLFRELGCSVETDLLVKGVRSEHRLDVSVRFTRFGLKQHWIIECKFWHRRVPKERVEVLKSITAELGADRGILIAERGHQSGAHEAAALTNITLTTLTKLREAAKGDLLALGLSAVRRRAIVIRDDLRSDVGILSKIAIDACLVELGANDAERGLFPFRLLCHFDEKDNVLQSKHHPYRAPSGASKAWFCNNLEEFVVSASDLLDTLDRVLLKQKIQAANGAPD